MKIDILKFLKRHRRTYRHELGLSIQIPKWIKENTLKPTAKAILASKFLPGVKNDIINIIRTLERFFNVSNKDLFNIAVQLKKEYGKEIDSYMKNWFDYGKPEQRVKTYSSKKAFKEQIARGFMDKKGFKMDPNIPYLQSNVNVHFIYPKQYDITEMYRKFIKIGVSGHTRIVLPKKLYNR